METIPIGWTPDEDAQELVYEVVEVDDDGTSRLIRYHVPYASKEEA